MTCSNREVHQGMNQSCDCERPPFGATSCERPKAGPQPHNLKTAMYSRELLVLIVLLVCYGIICCWVVLLTRGSFIKGTFQHTFELLVRVSCCAWLGATWVATAASAGDFENLSLASFLDAVEKSPRSAISSSFCPSIGVF